MSHKLLLSLTGFLIVVSFSAFSRTTFVMGKSNVKETNKTTRGGYEITLKSSEAENVAQFLSKSQIIIYRIFDEKKGYEPVDTSSVNITLAKRITSKSELTYKKILSEKLTDFDFIPYLGDMSDKDSIILIPYLGEEVKTEPLIVIFDKKEDTSIQDGRRNSKEKCYEPTITDLLTIQNLENIKTMFGSIINRNGAKNAGSINWDCCTTKSVGQTCSPESIAQSELDKRIIYYDFAGKYFFKTEGGTKKLFNFSSLNFAFRPNFQIKVININRYLYEVGIESQNLEYDSEMPALFRNLMLGDSTSTMGTLIDIFGRGLTNADKSENTETVGNTGSIITPCLTEIEFKYKNLQQSLVYYNSLGNYLKRRKLEAFALCSKFPGCCDNGSDDYGTMYELMLNALQHINVISSDLQMLLEREQGKNEAYKNMSEMLKQIQSKIPSESDLTKLFLFVQNIRNTNGEYISPPMSITGNRFELLIKFKPWDASMDKPNDPSYISQWNSGPYYKDEIYIDFPVLFRPFVSFSSGSFIALNRNLQEITYEWQKIPSTGNMITDSAKYRLVQTGYSRLPIGFSAFANVQTKVLSMVGLGISAGVGLTIDDKPRIAYLAGGSLFLGDLKQFVVTIGFAGMQVDRLNQDFQTYYDQNVVAYENTRPAIKYYSEFKVGGFISLSYTPFKVNKRPVYSEILKTKAAEAVADADKAKADAEKAKADAGKVKPEADKEPKEADKKTEEQRPDAE